MRGKLFSQTESREEGRPGHRTRAFMRRNAALWSRCQDAEGAT